MKLFRSLLVIILLFSASCKEKKQAKANMQDNYYTCSMHPQVMQDKPGVCPICHMDLIVVKKTQTAMDEIQLNDEQMQLGNIVADTIHQGILGDKLVLTATLNADETKVNSVNARIGGRVDRLYFKSAGDFVSKGAHLYDLYSEELNNAKQEYLAALERKKIQDNSIIDFDKLINSAKTKLLLWGMSEAQIAALAEAEKSSPVTAFFSNVSGYITELPVTEGQYIMEGGTVMKIADLSTLWAEAQVYSSQLSGINENEKALVEFPDMPGKKITGSVQFINPEIVPGTRINLLRVNVPGSGGLKPGMPAYVTLTRREEKSLTLPMDAVLRDGKMSVVWVKTGENSFKMRMVETGIETGDRIAIRSGLKEGDIVVTNGAYLINSEYIFKKGTNTMGGMDMSTHQH